MIDGFFRYYLECDASLETIRKELSHHTIRRLAFLKYKPREVHATEIDEKFDKIARDRERYEKTLRITMEQTRAAKERE